MIGVGALSRCTLAPGSAVAPNSRRRASVEAMSSTSNERWVSPRWFLNREASPWTSGTSQPMSSSRKPPLVRYCDVIRTGAVTSETPAISSPEVKHGPASKPSPSQ